MNAITVTWYDEEITYNRTIMTIGEALDTVNRVLKTQPSKPTMVEFYIEDGPSLAIGIGRDHTVVTFEYTLDPPYFISLGDPKQTIDTWFYYGNEETEYPDWNIIPLQDGMEALKYFIEHRDKPNNIKWEDL